MKQKLITIFVTILLITFTCGTYFFTKKPLQFIQVPQPFLSSLHTLTENVAKITKDYDDKLKAATTKEEYEKVISERNSITEQINKVYSDTQKDIITTLVKEGTISPKHIDNYTLLYTPKKNFILSYMIPANIPDSEKAETSNAKKEK